jgi:hypothetical protein
MENNPHINPEKRVIVSRLELETMLSPETANSARQWVVSMNLQDVIDRPRIEPIRKIIAAVRSIR